jgi:acyl-CoA thioester hydrolase
MSMALVAAGCYREAIFGGGRELDFSTMDYSEKMISTLPVTVRRRVKFGECDPAGVVYTPVFSEYSLSAYQWFLQAMLGGPMFSEMKRVGFDSPIKALTFEFRNMLVTEQVFDMTCKVTDIRTRTFDVEITGRSATATPHDIYVSTLTPIMLSRSERRSIEIPAELRQKLEAYRAALG